MRKNQTPKTHNINAGDIVQLKPRTDGLIIHGEDRNALWEVLAAPVNAPLYLRLVDGAPGDTCGAFPTGVTVVIRKK